MGQMWLLKRADGYVDVHYATISILCVSEKFYNEKFRGKNTTEEKKASLDKISKRLQLSCLLSERFSLAKASITDDVLTVQLFLYYTNGHLLTNRPWTKKHLHN